MIANKSLKKAISKVAEESEFISGMIAFEIGSAFSEELLNNCYESKEQMIEWFQTHFVPGLVDGAWAALEEKNK